MPIKINDKGKNNQVDIPEQASADLNGAIMLNGDNNHVRIGLKCRAANISMSLGHDCAVEIANNCVLGAIQIVALRKGVLSIGDASAFTWGARLYLHEEGVLRIGANCLIAGQTLLTVSDMHTVLDLASGERINRARDITVADKVWLGEGVSVLKGSTIGAGSVIGLGAVVAGAIPPNVLAVGVPAKVVRENIGWRPDLI